MSDFNYIRGMHCPLVIGFQQSQFSPSSLAFLYATEPRCPPYIQVWKDSASQSNNTSGGLQKQMGERRTHGWSLCGRGHCHSIFGLWSDNQHCLQGGYHIPCHNWRHPALHMPGFHKNVLSCIGKEREMSVLQASLLCVWIFVQGGL